MEGKNSSTALLTMKLNVLQEFYRDHLAPSIRTPLKISIAKPPLYTDAEPLTIDGLLLICVRLPMYVRELSISLVRAESIRGVSIGRSSTEVVGSTTILVRHISIRRNSLVYIQSLHNGT